MSSQRNGCCWRFAGRKRGCCCSSSDHNSTGNGEEDNEISSRIVQDKKEKPSPALSFVAKTFSRRPFLVLFITLSVSTIVSKFGISEYGFPDFEDPYLGFETRFTPIAKRLITLENLRKDVNKLESLENYPGEKLTGREFRRKRKKRDVYDDGYDEIVENQSSDDDIDPLISAGYCTKAPLDEYSRVALEIAMPKDVFSHEIVISICYFQKLTEVLPEYGKVCEHDDNENCCPMWSLPNYIAEYTNNTDCSTIKEYDIQLFKEGMHFCRDLYRDPAMFEACTLKHELCRHKCHRDEAIYSAMFLTVDKGYSADEDIMFSIIILPTPKSRGSRSRTAALQTALINIKLPEVSVSLAGFDFGDKDLVFKRYLISDLQYVVAGSAIIFLILVGYTKSISVSLISFLVLVLSLGISYFLYTAIFRIPYFPFMNMLVSIIVMGIGTDGTLILGAEWQRLKSKYKDPDQKAWDKMMLLLLQETTAPLVVTTCTTAGAFFASLTSSITTIRCFSIFAGTSIIVGFILLYFCVPTTLLLSDMCISYLTSLFSDSDLSTSSQQPSTQNGKKISSKVIKFVVSIKSFSVIKCPDKVKNAFQKQSTVLWTASFLSLLSILMWACLVLFHEPGFQLPNSEQFQLLSTRHPIERFDREIEPRFPGFLSSSSDAELSEEQLTIYFIWGVLPEDNGYGLDPHDNGALQFDKDFSLEQPKSQKWMRKLCSKLKKQSFYNQVSNTVVGAHYDSCFMDTMQKWMKRDCQHVFIKNETYKPCCKSSKFPYDAEVFTKCVEVAARDLYRTPTAYFQPDIAGPKFFILRENSNNSHESAENSGHLATFTLRVRTNITFSLSYEKMYEFYQTLETFYQTEVQDKVPSGLDHGFFISAHLDFFDLQNSLLNDTWMSVLISAGLCFGFLWIFSRSFLVSVGAVLCIVTIVIVSSAVLISVFNWKLGVFESIAVTVAVGLSDFTAHHSLEFSKRKSVLKMTSPTFFSAMTTITIGLSMLLFSNVLVYQQIGAFFTVLIFISWLYSVFFLSPILDLFEKMKDLCISICRLYFADGYGGSGRQFNGNYHSHRRRSNSRTSDHHGRGVADSASSGMDNVSAVVFSNPMASNDSRRNSNEELEEGEEESIRIPQNLFSVSRCNLNSPNSAEYPAEEPSAIIEKQTDSFI
ncbi:protein dispatched homolog 1 isoform X3 [Folsomia candida]|uniref:protein dispatched homolog 1 isoform X3 n=1 Tax=Folsomia candida TaxID=158441 RepID=UPI001604E106|nr:protein dispatched homolog 1 isoform X3 [Folsomia candida]